jgi:hypothetical protein
MSLIPVAPFARLPATPSLRRDKNAETGSGKLKSESERLRRGYLLIVIGTQEIGAGSEEQGATSRERRRQISEVTSQG